MICKKCNEIIPDNLENCPKCGAKTGTGKKIFCTHCGAELTEADEFCTSCGTYTEKKKQEIESNNSSVYSYAALGFVVPIVGIILAICISKSNSKGAKVIAIASLIGFIIEASVFIPTIFTNLLY